MAIPFGYQGTSRRAKDLIQRAVGTVANSKAGRAGMLALNSAAASSGSGMGTLLAGNAQRFGFPDPSQSGALPLGYRTAQYAMGWMAYTNEVFEQIAYARGMSMKGFAPNSQSGYNPNIFAQRIYNQQRGLYARTMPLYNPVRQLVDFYVAMVFPGALSIDGSLLPDGMPLAIPLGTVDQELKTAIAQGWAWGNWQRQKGKWIRFGAATGDGFLEVIDDVGAGRVYAEPVWPGEITHLELSGGGAGHVTAYNRTHRLIDENGDQFSLTRVVTPERVETYRDGSPYPHEGMPAAYDNEYGFCPLVYNPHVDLGTTPGGMAVRNWNKIEKLNSLASRVDQYIVKLARTPMMLSGGSGVTKVKIDGLNEDEVNILQVEEQGALTPIVGNLDLADAEVRIESMLKEIEHDHPEIVMWRELAGMSQVTGPAAEQLLGNVKGYVIDARSGYDDGEVRKNGMLVSIGGMRYKEGKGGWAQRNSQQQKFAPFDLDSYARGDLEHTVLPRPLLQPSREQEAQTKTAVAGAIATMAGAGEPMDFQIGEYGENWPPEKIAALHAAQEADHTAQVTKTQAITDAMAPKADGSGLRGASGTLGPD